MYMIFMKFTRWISLSLVALLSTSGVMAQGLECSGVLKQGGMIACQGPAGADIALDGVRSRTQKADANGWAVFGLYRDESAEVRVSTAGLDPVSFVVRRRHDPARQLKLDCDKIDARTPEQQKQASEGWLRKVEAFKRFHPSPAALTGFTSPSEGRISSPFGPLRKYYGVSKETGKPCQKSSWHRGYDIAAPTGTPILAPAGGTVIMADPDLYYEGAMVVVDHGLGLTSLFMHMSQIDVEVGDVVSTGQQVGLIGMTGRTTGPHLHWAVKWRNAARDDRDGDFYIDPALLLEWRGDIFGANPPPIPSIKTS